MILSAYYGLPLIPFNARKTSRGVGVVANQPLIDEVFNRVDTWRGGSHLLFDQGLSFDQPDHLALINL